MFHNKIPGSSSFSEDIIPYNLRLNYKPIELAIPLTVPQVQAAVACAAELGIKVNPKSGGHSYASHGIGGEDGHLVIDLKYFDSINLDNETKIVTVGPGTRLGNMALALFNQSGRAIAHGICPGVGIGGHVLHGGQGYSSHTYGLALDFLTEAEVILANSSVVTASTTENPDLFWALRGAGMSYGIVTGLKFRTIAAPPENVLFYYPYIWNRTQAFAGWDAFQSYAAGLTSPQIPVEMNVRIVIVNATGAVDNLLFILEGAYHGSTTDFLAAIAPLTAVLNATGGLYEANTGVYQLGWLDALLYANNNALFTGLDNGEVLETPFNYTAHATFFAKSLMTKDLSAAGVDAWINHLYDTTPLNPREWYFIITAQGGPTSVTSQVPVEATSYAHRDQIFEWQLVDGVSSGLYPDAEGIAWLNPFVSEIQAAEPNTTFGMYYNYADPTLTPSEAHERYWLFNYERLSEIKSKFDPNLLFLNPQTVNSI